MGKVMIHDEKNIEIGNMDSTMSTIHSWDSFVQSLEWNIS